MNHFNLFIKRIVKDHHTVGYTGLMLIGMGTVSFADNFLSNFLGINFNISHGFIFMGVFNILLAIAFILMGTANIEMSIEQKKELQPADLQIEISNLTAEIESLKQEIEKLKK